MAENKVNVEQVLAFVQSELHVPKNQFNSFGGYKYRSCEDIQEAAKPILKAAGATLYLSDDIVEVGGRVYVNATATFAYNGEKIIVTSFAREEESKKGMDAAQITGSASSYARKYALNGLFLLDDSNDPDTQDNRDTNADKPKAKTQAKKQSQTPKQMFWEACQATVAKDGAENIKAEATNLSKSMISELGHEPTDEDFTDMAFVLESGL